MSLIYRKNKIMKKSSNNFPVFLLLVTSLGYFVDAFDLVVFSAVRNTSVVALKLAETPAEIKNVGLTLENWQALGLLIGGVFWGVFGDRLGRLKVLFGSIAVYSAANLLNGLLTPGAHTLTFYSMLRFFSGLGLAGELGAAITLVSEAMKAEKRGLGTMIIAGFGLLGCALAAFLSAFTDISWQALFIAGGISGFVLLLLRIRVIESDLYLNQPETSVARGEFLSLFTNFKRFKKFVRCIGLGLPVYFVVGLPIKFATNFGAAFNISGTSVPIAIMMCYLFLALGDFVCNYLSQVMKSRKKPFYIFNALNLFAVLLFVYYPPQNAWQYHYIYCPILGFSVGYWALTVTIAAESFGTNLRATVTTSVPNFIRSAFIPIALCFTFFESRLGTVHSAMTVGLVCTSLSILSAFLMKETFGVNLNYQEK